MLIIHLLLFLFLSKIHGARYNKEITQITFKKNKSGYKISIRRASRGKGQEKKEKENKWVTRYLLGKNKCNCGPGHLVLGNTEPQVVFHREFKWNLFHLTQTLYFCHLHIEGKLIHSIYWNINSSLKGATTYLKSRNGHFVSTSVQLTERAM